VVELHGSIRRTRCLRRSCSPAFDDPTVPEPRQVPRCGVCGRAARPDIVLFGERLLAAHLRHLKQRLRQADLVLYCGTSGTVFPARDLIDHAPPDALRILVNKEPWDVPHPGFHHTILAPAEEALPALLG
jgi:NAD-dependent SIR2 family protein deacetylase